MRNKYFIFLVLILLCLPSTFALIHAGFFQSDDGEWMIIRFSAFYQALREGQFPVRFLSRLNYGYGYPVADFLYPGFMYLGVPIHILGFGFVDTIKIILGLSMVLSGIFSYLWLSKLFKTFPAVLGALFYVYAPYHLFDIYTRGSVGEVLALGAVPFILWQIETINARLLALGIAVLILSHNTLAVLFIPVIIMYMLLTHISNKKNIRHYLLSLLFGFGLSAFFWFPAIYDLQYTVFSTISVSDFTQYFVDYSLIGVSTLTIFAIVAVLLFKKIQHGFSDWLAIGMFMVGIVSVVFSLSISSPLWNILPVSFIQFPFRFLSICIVCASFLLSYIMTSFSKYQAVLAAVFIVLIFISSITYLSPKQYFNKGDDFYTTNEGTTTVKNEYMPIWTKIVPEKHPNTLVEGVNATISNITTEKGTISFTIDPQKDAAVKVNKVYFPGWTFRLDKKPFEEVQIKNNPEGVIYFSVADSEGKVHRLDMWFQETLPRYGADLASICSLIALVGYNLRKKFI